MYPKRCIVSALTCILSDVFDSVIRGKAVREYLQTAFERRLIEDELNS